MTGTSVQESGSSSKHANDAPIVQIDENIYLGPVHKNNVEQLRRLQEAILPVSYKSKFYDDTIRLSEIGLCKLAYFRDCMVATACCRLEDRADGNGKMLYIMTLATLPAYRGRGIGTHLVKYMIEKAKELGAVGVYLHVWTTNTSAIDFYKNFDFEVKETLKNYYKKIDPPDCHVLEKMF